MCSLLAGFLFSPARLTRAAHAITMRQAQGRQRNYEDRRFAHREDLRHNKSPRPAKRRNAGKAEAKTPGSALPSRLLSRPSVISKDARAWERTASSSTRRLQATDATLRQGAQAKRSESHRLGRCVGPGNSSRLGTLPPFPSPNPIRIQAGRRGCSPPLPHQCG